MTAAAPVSLYVGRTAHCRFAPRLHRFSYSIFQVLLDIDRLDEALKVSPLLRRGRWGVFSFDQRDHGWRDKRALRPWVEAQLAAANISAEGKTIRLLCFPRVLGFVFNPISIFFIYSHEERLEAVIYEVSNTFGQTHAYVLPATGAAQEHQAADKRLYVSPFYRVEGGYSFRLTPPGERFKLLIVKQVGETADFTASLHARRQRLTTRALLSVFCTMPFMTLGVVAAIHWEALRLLIKGAPFGARPSGPKAGVSAGVSIAPTS